MIHVSKMTGKLEGFQAINFNPLDNEFCRRMAATPGTVCTHCYSTKMLKTFRKSCSSAFSENAKKMSEVIDDQELPRFMPGQYVRFLSHGELENETQAYNFIRIAEANPKSNFTIWTKRVGLLSIATRVYDCAIPKNLTIVQSSFMLGRRAVKNPLTDILFTVYENLDSVPLMLTPVICNGKKCRECMHCYTERKGDVAELLRK